MVYRLRCTLCGVTVTCGPADLCDVMAEFVAQHRDEHGAAFTLRELRVEGW